MKSPRTPDRQQKAGGNWTLVRSTGLLYVFAAPLDFVPGPFGTPATVAGAAFLTTWLFALVAGARLLPKKSLAAAMMAILIFWSAITSIWSVNPDASLTQAISFTSLSISAVAIGGTFRDEIRKPAWAMLTGAGVVAAATIVSGPEVTQSGRTLEQATFLGIDQNILAFHLCLGFAAGCFLLLTTPRGWPLLTSLTIALGIAFAILMVGSRTGGGALASTVLLFVLLGTKSARTTLVTGLLVGAGGLGFYELYQQGRLPSRLLLWFETPTMTDQRSLIIDQYWTTRDDWIIAGVGAGADADYLQRRHGWYKNAHSAFWKTWIELGVFGVAIWFFMLADLTIRALRSSSRLCFVLVLPTIVAFFVTLGPLNSNMLWVVFGLALGQAQLGK